MLVSICIPTYNGSAYLSETLESALAQAYPNFEVLVIDDLSTDNTLEIASSYAAIDSRIRIFQNPYKLGMVANWNRCIELSKGEWIKFLFQDDMLAPDCIEKMIYSVQNSLSKAKVIFCRKDHIFENISNPRDLDLKMNKIKFFWNLYPNKLCITPQDTIKLMLKWPGRNIFGEPSSYMIHREVFDRIGTFDDSFYHICDLEYWIRIGVNLQVLMIPEILVHFRIHEKSASNYNLRKRWLQRRYLDKIRLLKKFMYDDSYGSLRKEINTWPCNMYLKTLCSIYFRVAEAAVRKEKNAEWDMEFAVFCKENSDIIDARNTNYLILIFRYFISRCFLHIKWLINSCIS